MMGFGMTAHAQDSLSGVGLAELPVLTNAETRMVSPENPTGEKGKGAMAVPNVKDPTLPFSSWVAEGLGQGWKVSPFIKVKPHQTVTLMDVAGPAVIQHIWMTSNWLTIDADPKSNDRTGGRAFVLRFYWDNETSPSIEVPMTDFFAIGHDRFATVNSLSVVVNPKLGLNCYWPMPFRKHGRITFTNDSEEEIPLMTYQITYALTAVPANAGYFHAQWRRAVTDRAKPDYTILDGVKGQGRYVGTFLSWTQLSTGWSGEGEVKFYLDDDKAFPTIVGTGTEDYFGSSHGFPETYSTAYVGNTLKPDSNSDESIGNLRKWSLYRWHLMDPINFQKNLRVTIQALGWLPQTKDPRMQPQAEDFASVAYWYQNEPHAAFPQFPPLSQRWPR